MFSNAKTILRVGGVPVRADASWAVILVLLAWSFWSRFTTGQPRYPVGVAFAMAVVASLLFGGSVLAHELAHAFVAKRRGVQVEGITLYLFGGATEIVSEARRWGDEFALTAAGPLTSLGLALVFGLIAFGADRLALGAVTVVAGELAWLNGIVGAFNLLPGSPLDGGRLLEAVVWRVTGDRLRATRVAAAAGRLIGMLLLVAGVVELFFVLGGAPSGLWLGLIGWFLIQGARAEEAQAEIRRLLANVPAERVAAQPVIVPATTPLPQVVEDWFRHRHIDAVLVADNGTPTGVLTLDAVRRLHSAQRAESVAGQVARPLTELPSIAADQPVTTVLYQLARNPVVVRQDDRIVGLLTMEHVAAVAERARQLERQSGGRPGWP